MNDRQLTQDAYGHIVTNIGCWSADGQWIVYDTRSDAAGSAFDGRWIERAHVRTGRVERLYESQRGACCGVVTSCPVTERVVFIHGPETPTADWQYAAYHRCGVVLKPGESIPVHLDAMSYCEPFVPGALRGGSHVHTFDARGEWVAFTYEDHVLASAPADGRAERNHRNVGVSVPVRTVEVPSCHPRNHSGSHFSVLVTQTWDAPEPGSDQIDRAYEDAWIGREGFQLSSSAARQRAIAFLGDILTERGARSTELFVVDLPSDVTVQGADGPLEGTTLKRPRPPRGTRQRRLTFTQNDPAPGISGPRHWPRSTPDGSQVFFLRRDAERAAQLWSISPAGGDAVQLTQIEGGVSSAFSVSPDGQWIAHVAQGCVCATSTATGRTHRLTEPRAGDFAPRPEACVFSPAGDRIAYVRRVAMGNEVWNQVCVVDADL